KIKIDKHVARNRGNRPLRPTARPAIPAPDKVVFARRKKSVALFARRNTPNARVMCVPGSLILRGIQSNAAILGQSRANAVLMNGATAIAGEQPRAVVRKRNRLQLVELIDAVNLTTRANIKEKDFVVLATRCDPASVARKRNAHHGCTVP